MSLKTWIAALVLKIKLAFTHLEPEVQAAVHTGVIITQNLKNFVESPAADIITALIPGTVDDVIVAALRKELPVILSDLRLTDAVLAQKDPEAAVKVAAQALAGLTGDTKNAFLHALSIRLAQVASGETLSWSDAVYLLEYFYKNEFQAK